MQSQSFDVTVVGAGPGGYVAAIRAAQIGKRVALVERDRLGGVCLNWGCIPTKSLLKSAERYEILKEATKWGFELGEVHVSWKQIVGLSRQAADRLSKGVNYLMKKNGIEVFRGTGRFLSPNRLAVESTDGELTELQTTSTIIATGGRPALVGGAKVDGRSVLTSKEAMVLPEIPRSLVVVGAGAVGLEFAYLYSVFGSEVDLLEYCPTVLPGGDDEVCEALTRAFRKRGIRVHTSSKVLSVESANRGARVVMEQEGEQRPLEADVALIAVGVRGNVEGMGLEDIGVRVQDGFVNVDQHGETAVAGVYAIGDVRGPPMLAHVASAEGVHVANRLAGDTAEPIDYQSVPACIYCHPQVASVGMTQKQAEEAGYSVKVGRFPFSANGKAVAVGDTQGFVKLIADEKHGEILGAHIIGPEATELIGEVVLARTAELTVEDIHRAVHSHPTLSESVMEAAADWEGLATGI